MSGKIDYSKTWVTSDTHFFHRNIIRYCNRPFKNEFEMNAVIEKNWNELISEGDNVYHLGDVFFGLKGRESLAKDLMKRLNGNIFLTYGNHDNFTEQEFIDFGFKDVRDFYVIDDFFLCHYPLDMSNKFLKPYMKSKIYKLISQYNRRNIKTVLHGHSHLTQTDMFDGIPHYNVSTDLNDYKPIKFEELCK